VFLDRDGVLIEDAHLLVRWEDARILPGVPAALKALRDGGFRLVVISNQAVVARGLATEAEVEAIHNTLNRVLLEKGGVAIERYYFCPHHPQANVPAYRTVCDCRKPEPGLFLRAAKELRLDLTSSFAVGDRPSDILAGRRAGCRTVWVQSGRHLDPPIQSTVPMGNPPEPDRVCADLPGAADWILRQP
jgi:D-glycero-D-manno-heptose 1,7-bisphosphate phosphatase